MNELKDILQDGTDESDDEPRSNAPLMCHPREGGDPKNVRIRMEYYVDILCSKTNGTLYIGVTNDLHRHMFEHKNKLVTGFTEKYDVAKLVYVEIYKDVRDAIHREKCLKKWNRSWKLKINLKSKPRMERFT